MENRRETEIILRLRAISGIGNVNSLIGSFVKEGTFMGFDADSDEAVFLKNSAFVEDVEFDADNHLFIVKLIIS